MTSLQDLEKEIIARAEYGETIRPVRDWLVLLGCAAVLVAASVVWNVWVYLDAVNGETSGAQNVSAPAPDTGAIDAAQDVFAARAAEEAKYESTYRFVDPSQ